MGSGGAGSGKESGLLGEEVEGVRAHVLVALQPQTTRFLHERRHPYRRDQEANHPLLLPPLILLVALTTACPSAQHGTPTSSRRPILAAANRCRSSAAAPASQPAGALVRTASINLRADDPFELVRRLIAEVSRRGGVITQASQYEDSGSVTSRVPGPRFDETLCVLTGLGRSTGST